MVEKHVADKSAEEKKEGAKDSREPITLYFDMQRNSKRTMEMVFQEIRSDVYDCLIGYMETYGDAQHEFVVHASIFDLRRIPGQRDAADKVESYMEEVSRAWTFFIDFCSRKAGLKYDQDTREMKSFKKVRF